MLDKKKDKRGGGGGELEGQPELFSKLRVKKKKVWKGGGGEVV